jgi:hypothetical protein
MVGWRVKRVTTLREERTVRGGCGLVGDDRGKFFLEEEKPHMRLRTLTSKPWP